MNDTDKPTPIASLPDNWSVFNGHEVLPWDMSRAEAAATLRRARSLRTRGQAAIGIEALGRYRLYTFNTLILDTRRRRVTAKHGDGQPGCCGTELNRLHVNGRVAQGREYGSEV